MPPALGALSPNHWTTREVPHLCLFLLQTDSRLCLLQINSKDGFRGHGVSILGLKSTKHQAWFGSVTKECGVEGLAASRSKANKQPRLVERKVYFISDADNWGQGRVDVCPKANSGLPPITSGARCFIDRRRGLHAGTDSQLWPSSSNWSLVVWPESSWLF